MAHECNGYAGSPDGLKLAEEFVTPEQEAALIDHAEASGLAYSAYDPDNLRASTSYGWKYDFVNDTFVPCPPIPDGMLYLRDAAARFAGVEPDAIAECLLNRYEPGAVIQPHMDKPVWEAVIGISLGSQATMEFTLEGDSLILPVTLNARSVYLLAGPARYQFRHALPPHEATRWSITFRTWSQAGIALRELHAGAV